MNAKTVQRGWFQLTPFMVFVGLFLLSTFCFSLQLSPIFSCAVALIYSFCIFPQKKSLNEKIQLFVEGSARPTVVTMCYIYIFTSIFSYILKDIGGIDAAVRIGLFLIPSGFLLPGLFVTVSLFAVAIGTSMGTIAAFLPIGIGIAQTVGVEPALMAGLVVGGAMLGDNLSIISDTTIAATQTTGARMIDKFKENVWLVLPAAALTLVVLTFINSSSVHVAAAFAQHSLQMIDFVKVLPYVIIFALALAGIDVLAVLVGGIIAALGIGWWLGAFSFLRGSALLVEGFSKDQGGIHEVLILSLLVAGLSHIVEHNGGIAYLLERFSKHIKSSRGAEFAMAMLVFLVNAAVAINTVAILVTGPVAKRIAHQFGVTAKRTACLIDIFSCICQGILPYAPQLLLASSLAGVSSIAIMPHLHYQGFIFVVVVLTMIWPKKR
ncbi:hypothetical protein K2W90_05525 [Candidatus Babeliales bacterium]|nr:hypothetical protein [Candidatus Babeliales bacterium]